MGDDEEGSGLFLGFAGVVSGGGRLPARAASARLRRELGSGGGSDTVCCRARYITARP